VVFKVLASASTCDLTFSRPCVGFGMFAFCCPQCPYAARCPVPIAGDDAEVILELSFSWHADDGRLSWCDRNHGHGQSAHTHQAHCLLRSWPEPRVAFQLARRGGRRATADLSKRTIIAGCGSACLGALTSAIADAPVLPLHYGIFDVPHLEQHGDTAWPTSPSKYQEVCDPLPNTRCMPLAVV
jgi:hypothetical protein